MTVCKQTKRNLNSIQNIDDTLRLLDDRIEELRRSSISNLSSDDKRELHQEILKLVSFLNLLKRDAAKIFVQYVNRSQVEQQAPPDLSALEKVEMDDAIVWFSSQDGGNWVTDHVGFIRMVCSAVRQLTDPSNAGRFRDGETYLFEA